MVRSTIFRGSQQNMATIVSVIAAIAIISTFQIINPSFLSPQGRISLVYAMSYFLIAACGLTMVIMMGSFDFSVVSLLKLAALICVLYIDDIGLLVIPLALLVCTGFGFINGLLFARFKVPSFLATLGMSLVAEGLALYLSKGFLYMITNRTFRALSVTFIGGLPSIFYWGLGVWAVSIFVAFYTPFGRHLYAIGGNPTAASLCGVDVVKTRINAFMLSGFLAGLAGVLYMAQFGGGSIEMGADMSIPLFASVVAGGTSLAGGTGGPHRTLLGVILITWTQAGMSMLAMGNDRQLVIFALIAIGMSVLTTNRKSASIVK
ncbi:MAG: ribose transport system permease protein [Candidatus Atribacteria bacterium]|nr:ribose transport system permease protein [Candidatus Atribacteria bacterium]